MAFELQQLKFTLLYLVIFQVILSEGFLLFPSYPILDIHYIEFLCTNGVHPVEARKLWYVFRPFKILFYMCIISITIFRTSTNYERMFIFGCIFTLLFYDELRFPPIYGWGDQKYTEQEKQFFSNRPENDRYSPFLGLAGWNKII